MRGDEIRCDEMEMQRKQASRRRPWCRRASTAGRPCVMLPWPLSMAAMAGFSFARECQALRECGRPWGRNALPLCTPCARPLLPPVSPGVAPLLHVHEAPFALARSILCARRLPGSRCNSEWPFQSAILNGWPSALVPGSSANSTGTPRAAPGRRGYHSNDTACSPPPRAQHLLKTRLPAPAARGRIAAAIDCAEPSLLWNPAAQVRSSSSTRRGGAEDLKT